MQGHPDVIARLNQLLAGELSAIDQYFIHSRMCRNWGFDRLYRQIGHEMQEEIEHADRLIERILFLEGVPDLATRSGLNVGKSVPEIFNNDLALEYHVVGELREVMAFCESVGDYQTRAVLQPLLKDTEEDHAHWLESQLGLIRKIGLENYLQTQIDA